MKTSEGGLGFTWSDFGSSEQRKRHVKPNPDRPGSYQTRPEKGRF
ncbi:cation diffusion facilitator family transporter [Desmospora sp. 8437]|nr:cation diffusion facilitator family transporter [Desmospora sp. 8437]